MATQPKPSCFLLAGILLIAAGCGGDSTTTKTSSTVQPPATSNSKETTVAKTEVSKSETPKDDHDHSHERGKMLLADAGKHHALLTAHLSPKGNELDLFFETSDAKDPKPVALPLTSIKAFANVAGSSEAKEIVFTPAPVEERPKDEKAGTCSHFVAKTPWLKPTDEITVAVPLELGGERFRVTWEKFNPKKYAHHED
jgi:hypothetical protein